jgi:hypothetical protein
MIKGTTPTFTFTIPMDRETIEKVEICFGQRGEVLVTKMLPDCQIKENEYSVKLKQEDTLKFDDSKPVQVQVRVMTLSGDVLASNIKTLACSCCLSKEVL